MKRTVHKLFWIWDSDKEERWLNEMAARSLALSDVGWCRFTFEESVPGAYAVRLELLDRVPAARESENYIRFVEETGAEYVGRCLRWAYFRKQTAAGGFDLFSDIDSRMKQLGRIQRLLACTLPLLVFNSINLFFSPAMEASLSARIIGGLNLLLTLLGGYGFTRLLLKKRNLKAERQLHE